MAVAIDRRPIIPGVKGTIRASRIATIARATGEVEESSSLNLTAVREDCRDGGQDVSGSTNRAGLRTRTHKPECWP
jgi:hypothetical protein